MRDNTPDAAERVMFSPKVLPAYLRRTDAIEELIPWLYLKGISTSDFGEALQALVGEKAKGLGAEAIRAVGFQFLLEVTALRQIVAAGFSAGDVCDILVTHCDPDHIGGLADLPKARLHVAEEELRSVQLNNPRYRPSQLAHGPNWVSYAENNRDWFGLPSRRVDTSLQADIRLVPFFGHTQGHCGVAVAHAGGWLLHVGDAYYLRSELQDPSHPVGELPRARAEDDSQRLASPHLLRRLAGAERERVSMVGYHDTSKLPPGTPPSKGIEIRRT